MNYSEKKEQVRKEYLEWHGSVEAFIEKHTSDEVAAVYIRFIKLAKRYGLITELKQYGLYDYKQPEDSNKNEKDGQAV